VQAPHPKVRVAAAVLLTRETGAGREVYLVERSPELRFFGGYWACPGGVVEAADQAGGGEPGIEVLARCARRELFEETGVLLGAAAPVAGREALREALLLPEPQRAAGRRCWDQVVGGLQEPGLVPVATLTMPAFAPVRYQTQFFHAALPPGEEPTVLPGELRGGRFWRPRDVLAEWRTGRLLVVPPVLFLLELLQGRSREEFLAHAAAEAAALGQGKLHPVYFTPGILLAPLRTDTIPPATTTNCLLVGEEEVYVIDPASPDAEEQERLCATLEEWRAAGRHLAGVIATHHHQDHVGAVAEVSRRYRLPVLAHPLTLARLPEKGFAERPLHDGEVLPLGAAPDGTSGWQLQALHTPGHDRGHLAFLESRYRAAIVGDLVSTLSTIVIQPPEGHLATYLASLRRLLELPFTTLYPAHGPAACAGHDLVRHYLRHRQEREDSLVTALRSGQSRLEDLLASVYSDVSAELLPLAAHSLRAGLEKLEEEGRVQRVGQDAFKWRS